MTKKVEQPRSALPKSVAKATIGVSLAAGTLTLNLPRSVVGKTIKIVDVLGNVQMQKKAQGMNETMDVSSLKSGVYLVQVQGFSANKFIVK